MSTLPVRGLGQSGAGRAAAREPRGYEGTTQRREWESGMSLAILYCALTFAGLLSCAYPLIFERASDARFDGDRLIYRS